MKLDFIELGNLSIAAANMRGKRIDSIEAKRLEPSAQCCAVSIQRLLTCLVGRLLGRKAGKGR